MVICSFFMCIETTCAYVLSTTDDLADEQQYACLGPRDKRTTCEELIISHAFGMRIPLFSTPLTVSLLNLRARYRRFFFFLCKMIIL